jgi:DNA-binding IclR family transcriptional regulator
MRRADSKTHRILMFIREHPEGIRRREISEALRLPLFSVDGILARLRNNNLIYNNGVMGSKGSTWFPVTHNDVQEPFPSIAAELVDELRDIHYDGHELHLARRLQEIFG